MESKNVKLIELNEPSPPLSFISLSVLFHAAVAASMALTNLPSAEMPKKELLEFNVESEKTAPQAIPDGVPVPDSLGAHAPKETQKETKVESSPRAVPLSVPKAATAEASEPSPAQQVPETLEDIPTPSLEASTAEEESPAPSLEEADLAEAFAKADNTPQQPAPEAAAAEEPAAAPEPLPPSSEVAPSEEEGHGTGTSGSPELTLQVAGIPGGVRALDQLRQMPGNKFPQYSKEERLAREEGKAVFYAYVNKEGNLSQFKLGQSSGHRNLDLKTLVALKKWKFYPGQEGWVEMPFQWTLSGEARQAGGQLRVSR